VDHKPQQSLVGNELSFDIFFNLLSKFGKVYVAIELANADSLENAYTNHQESEYLRNNF
jgi:hypothetical protein